MQDVHPEPSSTPAPQRKRPTYADIEALAPGLRGEIIAGELVVMPRPALPHVRVASMLGGLLNERQGFGRTPTGAWWILHEPELRLGIDPDFDTVDPDLAGWRIERLPELPETASMSLAPDWVCEILSPSTMMRDRYEKLPFYARAGVSHAWIIDPMAETLEVYANVDGRWTVVAQHRGNVSVSVVPFDAHELPLDLLWLRRAPIPLR